MQTSTNIGAQANLLIVVEFEDQLEKALELTVDQEDICFLACTLGVADALRGKGIRYVTIADFTDDKDLQDLGEGLYRTVDLLCEHLDDILQENIAELKTHSIRPFGLEYYRMKVLFDGAIVRLTEMDNAIAALSPTEVFAFINEYITPDGLTVGADTSCLYGNDSIRVCQHRGVKVNVIADRKRNSVPASGKPIGRMQRAFQSLGARGLFIKGIRAGNAMIRGRRGGNKVLVLQPVVPDETLAMHVPVWRWRGGKVPVKKVGGFGGLKRQEVQFLNSMELAVYANDEITRSYFVHNGVDWFDYVSPHLEGFLASELPLCISDCLTADMALQKLNLKAVVGLNLGADASVRRFASRAKHARVPVIVLNHGAMGFLHEFSYFYQEIRYCSHYFVHGEGVHDYINQRYQITVETKIVGNPNFTKLNKLHFSKRKVCEVYGLDVNRPIVIFPTSLPLTRNRALNMSSEGEFPFFKRQQKIVQSILLDDEVQLIIKGHPLEHERTSALYRWVHELNHPQVTFISDIQFSNLLDVADCFVIDMPSTTLLEALTRSKNIYAFNRCYHWEDKGLALLDGEIYLERHDHEKFCETLATDIRTKKAFAPRQRKGDFLRYYGDHFGDGDAENRIISGIVELAQTGRWAA